MLNQLLEPGDIVALSTLAAKRLLDADNGEAALLYLHLLLRQNVQELKWTPARLENAYTILRSIGLWSQPSAPAPTPSVVIPDEPPAYTSSDITRELAEPSSPFPGLISEVQRRLGKILSTSDLKTLYTLYDHLALPAEVIFLLVNWCIEEYERKYGAGKRPRLSTISRQGFFWKSRQIDTVEAAEEFLRRKATLLSKEAELLSIIGVSGRKATDKERTFLESWLEMGFPSDVIRMAYERTLFQKQNMNWNYMNSILVRWHRQGLHTPEEIQKGDKPSSHRNKGQIPAQTTTSPGEADQRVREDMERMRAFMRQQKESEGGR